MLYTCKTCKSSTPRSWNIEVMVVRENFSVLFVDVW
ncbi:hypothetical protein LINPERPRIM_LOCUS26107 [Linum perenne]